jgi:hypothetical protein
MKRNSKSLKQAQKMVSQARRLVDKLSTPNYFNRSDRLNKVIAKARLRVDRRRENANALFSEQLSKLS